MWQVLSDFDIFSVVGANKPLQLVDLRVSMKENGVIVVRFEGVNGSPVVSGICVRKAPKVSGNFICISFVCFCYLVEHECHS
jgi:kinesin family protein C2/C3